MNKKHLIIGKNGYIAKKLLGRGDYYTTSSTDENADFSLDLLTPEAFDFDALDTSMIIIFLAAISSPDKCKNDFENSYQINVKGSSYLIHEFLNRGFKVLSPAITHVRTNVSKKDLFIENQDGLPTDLFISQFQYQTHFINESQYGSRSTRYVNFNYAHPPWRARNHPQ